MRILAAVLSYITAVLLLSALLFYPAWLAFGAGLEIRPGRLFIRGAEVIAALGIWPLLRWLQLNDRDLIGLVGEPRRLLGDVLRGLGWGVVILGVLVVGLMIVDARFFDAVEARKLSHVGAAIVTGLLAGLLVGLIEETFFRGILQGGMRRTAGFWTSAISVSVLYASLHFFRTAPIEVSDWSSGFQLLYGAFAHLATVADNWDSWVALFFAGMLLSLVRERSGSLALCIGVHAGWVLTIKVSRALTDPVEGSVWIGSYDEVTGWLAAIWLGALVALLWWKYRPAAATDSATDSANGRAGMG